MPTDEAARRVGSNVRALRRRLGLTQEQVAERTRIGWRRVQAIEGGAANVTLRTLDRLAAALEVDVAALLAPLSADG